MKEKLDDTPKKKTKQNKTKENMSMPYWRAAGMTYVGYANACAVLVRKCMKEPFKSQTATREKVHFKLSQWLDGVAQQPSKFIPPPPLLLLLLLLLIIMLSSSSSSFVLLHKNNSSFFFFFFFLAMQSIICCCSSFFFPSFLYYSYSNW